MTTTCTYTHRDAGTFRVSHADRRVALRQMRAKLLRYASDRGMRRNWFAPDEIVIEDDPPAHHREPP